MKRILIFNDSLEMGGTEKLLVDLLNHLVAKGCEVTLLLPQQSEKNVLLSQVGSAVKIRYIYASASSRMKRKIGETLMVFYPRLFNWLKGIKASDYDHVICFKETFYARIFSKMKVPKLLWIHNILYRRQYEIRSLKERLAVWLNKWQLRTVQRSYDRFDTVVCVSQAALNAYLDVLHDGKMPKQDIRIIYNAIDLSQITEKAKEPIVPLPQSRTNFILITRLSPEKRTDRLLRAADRLKQDGYDFHVYILGEGLDSPEMKQTLQQQGLGETVSLLGRVDNPFPYILQSNWLLCVSERESFSLTLLEAMALKTPVIATDCGGPADIVDGGKYGILVANSGEGVYEGMKSVLVDPTLSVRYSAHLDEAVVRFDYSGWHRKIDELLSIE
ncbi:glycosyltransferase [Dysgonomonas sp. 25]|uniref:glycosyltransferase n=1 Tax=Dysgonomonas sp. 25 TaxID=2302933 RepID=UPI0013CFB0B9|nr:glycosyltransferase [Dysgonomonas sp. 25]NDV69096.1 glycosyltransferase [Dysgonomonas sp. 25]